MKFGPLALTEAEGAVLAHSLRAGAVNFRKGRCLSAEDIDLLAEAGLTEVIAARLDTGDMSEDDAAGRIARAAAGAHVRAEAPFTGRANLYAEADGVVLIDPQAINRANRADDAITIATLAPFSRVAKGQMLATVKIIPFAAPGPAVEVVASLLTDSAIRLEPFRPHRAGLALTTLPGLTQKLLKRTGQVVAGRLLSAGSELHTTLEIAHKAGAVANAITRLKAEGCDPILLFGASAIVGPEDVLPAGLAAAGGRLIHLGMPVDPGNLLMLGEIGGIPVVGLPGCARSPKLNGFDWILERLLANIDVTKQDITSLGVGGLLTDSPARFSPRESPEPSPGKPHITALLLAAGQSRRMGAENKLLSAIDGKPMVRHAAEMLLASQVEGLIVVTGMDAEAVLAALDGLDFTSQHNPDYAAGLSTSLKAGLAALPDEASGFLVALSDMPGLKPAHINRLIDEFSPQSGASICVPTFNNKQGNPVLWGSKFKHEIMTLAGDVGARHLIGMFPDQSCEVAMDDDAVLTDLDTPEALAAYRQRAQS